MGKLGTIARRSFLVGSAAVLGGVAFGYYWYRQPGENPLQKGLPGDQAALTPYVIISNQGITLITPRTDVGQGAYSVQAALLAEELDVDLESVRIDPGPVSPVYYNTALAGEAVPFASTNDGVLAELARGVADAGVKFMGLQITGGSTTVPDGYDKLRIAGAVARETLKRAASLQSGDSLPIDEMETRNGAIFFRGEQIFTYEQLAETAATVEPVKRVHLKPETEWRYLGKKMQRVDIADKSTGRHSYGIDLKIDGMVHATIRSNPRMGGKMIGFDASAAEKIPGVRKVVEISDAVAVIADNTWAAFRGADAISFEWSEAPFPAEQDEHWATLSEAFNDSQLDSRNKDEGDVESAISKGEPLTVEYRAPYLSHAPLEPVSAIAKVTDDRVDIWTATQIPGFLRTKAAKRTGLSEDAVNVHVLVAGGSFGHRLEDDYAMKTLEVAMQMKGTPVKMTYAREEDVLHDFPRQIAMARGQGTVRDGKVETFDLSIAMPSVIASQMDRQDLSIPGPDVTIVAAGWDQPYSIENYRVSGYRAKPLAPISSWRSVGASTNSFFHECMLDELIHEAGAEPLEERLRLMWHEPSRKTLEAVGEMSGWGGDLSEGKGRGVAFTRCFGVSIAEVIEVTETAKGIRIDNVWVAAEVGRVLDPVNFENNVQGGVVWGLGHAMNCETTFSDGIVQQTNFHAFEAMRIYQCPRIEVRALENDEKIRGIGEPPTAAAAPALANAIFAATGKRIREMPFNKLIDFV